MNESTVQTRKSNIELLRIVAMFLVMVVHADFYSLGVPSLTNCHGSYVELIVRFFIQSLSICCVNLFVLISGYFGINPSFKGFLKFAFQCLFFFFLVYFLCIISGRNSFSFKGVADCFCLFRQTNWFIQAYILLYIMSPALNACANNISRAQLKKLLIAFYVFQTIYGLTGSSDMFIGGFSTISFMGLYLLARYIKLYPNKFSNKSAKTNFGLYFLIVIVLTAIGICPSVTGYTVPYFSSFVYINPLVILSSIFLFLAFTRINIGYSKTINFVAGSSFAVYLLHAGPHVLSPIYKEHILVLYGKITEWGGVVIVSMIAFMIAFYVAAIVIDIIRQFIWNKLVLLFEKYK